MWTTRARKSGNTIIKVELATVAQMNSSTTMFSKVVCRKMICMLDRVNNNFHCKLTYPSIPVLVFIARELRCFFKEYSFIYFVTLSHLQTHF